MHCHMSYCFQLQRFYLIRPPSVYCVHMLIRLKPFKSFPSHFQLPTIHNTSSTSTSQSLNQDHNIPTFHHNSTLSTIKLLSVFTILVLMAMGVSAVPDEDAAKITTTLASPPPTTLATVGVQGLDEAFDVSARKFVPLPTGDGLLAD